METQRITSDEKLVPPQIVVTLEKGERVKKLRFREGFLIGRGSECHVVLEEEAVSRVHAEVKFEQGRWWIRDLQSTNGTYVNGECLERASLSGNTKVRLGPEGPLLSLDVEEGDASGKTIQSKVRAIPEHIMNFIESPREKSTILGQAIDRALKLQSRKYVRIIGALGAVACIAVLVAYFNHQQLQEQKALAEEVFYELKELELVYKKLEKRISAVGDSVATREQTAYLDRRKRLRESYDRFVGELGIYSEGMDEKERVIYRVARMYGECEVGMPDGFVEEVLEYIGRWKKSQKLVRSVRRAGERGYVPVIANAMLAQNMPPQFFYLGLQESGFDSLACGPPTRFGIAKGIWQFIPATALEYGMRTGSLVHLPKADPKDERHWVAKSSNAAARYLRDIYDAEAQASGLLVIASYNWGHNVVRGLIRKLPENPRERNFWKFLTAYREKIPKETYEYVFYIIAATVIGENPGLFDFEMDNPLAAVKSPASL
ncbi:MAG: FHA domain-containing protein [Bacteroidota bacterium]